MRILHCIPTLGGGGAERQLALLGPKHVAAGHDVHVAFIRGGTYLEPITRGGVTAHHLPPRSPNDPRSALSISTLIRRLQPDIVQTWLVMMDVWGGITARLHRVPWILSERNCVDAYPPSLKNSLRHFLGRHATAVVANSRYGIELWRTGVNGQLRAVISNAIEFDDVDTTEPIAGVPPGAPFIVYVGRLSAEKNLETIVPAVVPILAERKDVYFAICGDGPLEPMVRAMIAKSGVADRILMPGFVPDVGRWLRRADVLIFLSWYEGNPNAVVEALANGTPVVLSDIAAHRELIDERSGILVDAASAADAEHAIRATLDDPAAARERAEHARRSLEGRSLDAVADQYISVYKKVLGELPA
jgi:glycosyltransferase involved in cell wall biosynthesis